MRVITGSARGRKLLAPPGTDVRPTSAQVKEAVFSAIQFEVEGARVLDLFAGSGQMGIEALSRGARSCVFVDSGGESIAVLRQNLARTGPWDTARVAPSDALTFLAGYRGEAFDIAFLDPPYSAGLLGAALPLTAELMAQSGVILCETDEAAPLPERVGGFHRRREYGHGKTKVGLYRPAGEA